MNGLNSTGRGMLGLETAGWLGVRISLSPSVSWHSMDSLIFNRIWQPLIYVQNVHLTRLCTFALSRALFVSLIQSSAGQVCKWWRLSYIKSSKIIASGPAGEKSPKLANAYDRLVVKRFATWLAVEASPRCGAGLMARVDYSGKVLIAGSTRIAFDQARRH